MIFNINIDQEPFTLEVSEGVLKEAQEFISEMDTDFNRGIQLAVTGWIVPPMSSVARLRSIKLWALCIRRIFVWFI